MAYTMTFKSLLDKTCVVTIDIGGSGTLTPSADPFEYEENDSEDMMEFVRSKTGYIRVRETADLSALYPTTFISHPVTLTYDGKTMFKGYMQPQTFENEWVALPRDLEFPVMSPLGIMEKYNFAANDGTHLLPGGYTQIGTLLAEVCAQFGITKVIFPKGMFPHSSSTADVLSYYVKNLTIAPYGDDFDYGQGDLQKPISYLQFIEALCNAFGLTVHDEPDLLVFTRINWTGDSYEYTMSSWDSPSTITYSGNVNIESGREVVGSDNNESIIAPLNKLELKSDGKQIKTVGLDGILERSVYNSQDVVYNGANKVIMLTNNLEFLGSGTSYPPQIDSEGKITNLGTWLGAFGKMGSLHEGILISKAETQTMSESPSRMKFLQIPDAFGYFNLRFKVIFGEKLSEMNLTDNHGRYLWIKIRCGSYYYHQDLSVWNTDSSVAAYNEVFIEDNSQDGAIDFIPNPYTVGIDREPIQLYIKSRYVKLTGITEMKLEADIQTDEYKYTVRETDKMKAISAGGGIDDSELSQMLNTWRNDEGHIYLDLSGAVQIDTVIGSYFSYMSTPQRRLDITMRPATKNDCFSERDYLNGLKFSTAAFGTSNLWRLAAVAFYPWDDEFRIKLHRNY